MKKEEKRGQMNIKDMFAKQSKRKAEESGGAPVAKKPKVCISLYVSIAVYLGRFTMVRWVPNVPQA